MIYFLAVTKILPWSYRFKCCYGL